MFDFYCQRQDDPSTNEYFDTTINSNKYASVLYDKGYEANTRRNNSAQTAYDTMGQDEIFIVVSHANAGGIQFYNAEGGSNGAILANEKVNDPDIWFGSNCLYIDKMEADQLTRMRCVLYIGCNTGTTYTYTSGGAYRPTFNLVDSTFNQGAHYVLGFVAKVEIDSANEWLGHFIDSINIGNSIDNSIIYADSMTTTIRVEYADGTKRNVTNMPIHAAGDGNQYLN